jgi:hypothetical protein
MKHYTGLWNWIVGSSEHGDEPLDSIQGRLFLEELSDYQVVKKGSVPCRWLVM